MKKFSALYHPAWMTLLILFLSISGWARKYDSACDDKDNDAKVPFDLDGYDTWVDDETESMCDFCIDGPNNTHLDEHKDSQYHFKHCHAACEKEGDASLYSRIHDILTPPGAQPMKDILKEFDDPIVYGYEKTPQDTLKNYWQNHFRAVYSFMNNAVNKLIYDQRPEYVGHPCHVSSGEPEGVGSLADALKYATMNNSTATKTFEYFTAKYAKHYHHRIERPSTWAAEDFCLEHAEQRKIIPSIAQTGSFDWKDPKTGEIKTIDYSNPIAPKTEWIDNHYVYYNEFDQTQPMKGRPKIVNGSLYDVIEFEYEGGEFKRRVFADPNSGDYSLLKITRENYSENTHSESDGTASWRIFKRIEIDDDIILTAPIQHTIKPVHYSHAIIYIEIAAADDAAITPGPDLKLNGQPALIQLQGNDLGKFVMTGLTFKDFKDPLLAVEGTTIQSSHFINSTGPIVTLYRHNTITENHFAGSNGPAVQFNPDSVGNKSAFNAVYSNYFRGNEEVFIEIAAESEMNAVVRNDFRLDAYAEKMGLTDYPYTDYTGYLSDLDEFLREKECLTAENISPLHPFATPECTAAMGDPELPQPPSTTPKMTALAIDGAKGGKAPTLTGKKAVAQSKYELTFAAAENTAAIEIMPVRGTSAILRAAYADTFGLDQTMSDINAALQTEQDKELADSTYDFLVAGVFYDVHPEAIVACLSSKFSDTYLGCNTTMEISGSTATFHTYPIEGDWVAVGYDGYNSPSPIGPVFSIGPLLVPDDPSTGDNETTSDVDEAVTFQLSAVFWSWSKKDCEKMIELAGLPVTDENIKKCRLKNNCFWGKNYTGTVYNQLTDDPNDTIDIGALCQDYVKPDFEPNWLYVDGEFGTPKPAGDGGDKADPPDGDPPDMDPPDDGEKDPAKDADDFGNGGNDDPPDGPPLGDTDFDGGPIEVGSDVDNGDDGNNGGGDCSDSGSLLLSGGKPCATTKTLFGKNGGCSLRR